MFRFLLVALLLALTSAFMAPVHPAKIAMSKVVMQHGGKGFGGGEATRDPEPTFVDPNDPKGKQQAIHKAESFADYLAKRDGGASAAAAPAPAPAQAPAPAPVAAQSASVGYAPSPMPAQAAAAPGAGRLRHRTVSNDFRYGAGRAGNPQPLGGTGNSPHPGDRTQPSAQAEGHSNVDAHAFKHGTGRIVPGPGPLGGQPPTTARNTPGYSSAADKFKHGTGRVGKPQPLGGIRPF